MKKLMLVLLAALCACLSLCASAEMNVVSLDGLTIGIPALPVRYSHQASATYSDNTEYDYAWKFESDSCVVLQLQYNAYSVGFDYAGYAENNRLAEMAGAEVENAEDHICIYYMYNQPAGTFFLMGESAVGIYLDTHGMVGVIYENDALTAEEELAEVKTMMSSVKFTAFTEVTAEEKLEEAEAATVDEVKVALAQSRTDNVTELDLTCAQDLYDQLSADRCAYLSRLCCEAGIEDLSIRYYDATCAFKLKDLEYADVISYIWADTMEEAEAAVSSFIDEGFANFTLGCSGDVYTELLTNRGIRTVLEGLGMADYDLYYTSDSIIVKNLVRAVAEE